MKRIKKYWGIIFLLACQGQTSAPIDITGTWQFESYIEEGSELNPHEKAMVSSVVKLFEGCQITYHSDSTVEMSSKTMGSTTGTYFIEEGKLSQKMGASTHFILNVGRQKDELTINFARHPDENGGRIVLKEVQ